MRSTTTAWRLAGLLSLVRYGGIATWWGWASDETALVCRRGITSHVAPSTNCTHEESPSVLIVAIPYFTLQTIRHADRRRHTPRRPYETILICPGVSGRAVQCEGRDEVEWEQYFLYCSSYLTESRRAIYHVHLWM
ncbi:hypothetical protein F5Y03DRAFT_57003 [Xylaria venustula]|nr:hypothetical protein F5Y03DRAFT_57003 [Xylaria venustula]